jgi:hypothetical protein
MTITYKSETERFADREAGVRGTPTLIIVDATGVVKQSWVGRLNAERESEVLGRIKI